MAIGDQTVLHNEHGDNSDKHIHFTLIDNQLKIIQVIRVIRLTCSMLRPDRGSLNL
jgi:hypothetical protein